MKKAGFVILDNIRSTHNVGSIFRTADALGFSRIFLCGTTPCPKDRFGRKRKDVAKVSLGAEEVVPYEYCKNTLALVKKLKKEGVCIISLEQNKNSIPISKLKIKKNFALILGNEVGGVDKRTLKISDEIAEIKMVGQKESLNVSVAFGIAGFEIMK